MAETTSSNNGRRLAWRFMCCCRGSNSDFSAQQIADATEMSRHRAAAFLRQLFKEGRLEVTWHGRSSATNRYRLIDASPLAEKTHKPKRAKAMQRVWNSCRIMRAFTLDDVIATAQVAHSTAKRYVKSLQRAGLIRVRGTEHGITIYRLNVDCGQAAPELTPDGIFAPTRRTFYPYREDL
jgi:hypothetical protein